MLDLAHLPPETLIAMVVATGFAAGLNVSAAALTVGLLARAGSVTLPAPIEVLGQWWAISAFAGLFALEFVADKIPAFDLIWNVLQTVVRVPAGALLGYAAAAHLSPGQQLLTAALGAGMALAAHTGKTAMRAAVTPSPEPISNVALSLAEDAAAIGLTWFATEHPFIAATVVVVLLAAMVLTVRALWRLGARLVRH